MFTSVGNLIGGLGLLLIGMSLMTDGLKLAAGNALRDILALWTNTRARGLFSGFLITGIVQSSSAVTVATIGFANAGMLSLEKALWVIFGSNVGTTMTAWIVALVGFKVNIEVFALPLVGIGTMLKLTGGSGRRASIGLAIVGFGLLFLGIEALKNAFDAFGSDFTLARQEQITFLTIISYVGIGFLLTTLMQSSSAAMVVALSAAEGGLMPFNAAAAVVIGANLGTTTTAIISVFGATSTAKRVAFGHVCFNVLTAIVAILLLAPMIWAGGLIQDLFNLENSPAVSLAIFHSSFNILGVLLMWPLTNWVVEFLLQRFQTKEETESKPKFLDKNVLALPYIAVDTLALEISRIATFCIGLFQETVQHSEQNPVQLESRVKVIRNLADQIGIFSTQVYKTSLTPFLSEALLNLIHTTQEYLLTLDIIEDIGQLKSYSRKYKDSEFGKQLFSFITAVDKHLDAITPDNSLESIKNNEHYSEVEETYDTLKEAILLNTSFGQLEISEMDQLLQFSNQVKRGCRHLWKAARRLSAVRESLQRDPEDMVVESETPDTENIVLLKDTAKELDSENTGIYAE